MVRRRTWTVVLVAIVLLGSVVTYGILTVERPRIESVDSEWGTVTDDRAEVETRITVDNPRLLRVGDAVADVSYTVSLNDVDVATERKTDVELPADESVIAVSTWIDTDDIPAWWATHVDRNETTTVRVDPDVVVDYTGVEIPADRWTQTRTVRTDLLEPLRTNRSREVRVGGETMAVVDRTDARWGNATAERTPINASATVTNPTPLPIPVSELGYTVRLNGIVVGQGVTAQRTVLSPNETQTLTASAGIDTTRLEEWWPTHLRNDETSTLTVDFNATVEYGGVERTVPLDALSYTRTFRTDILGSGTAHANDADPESARVRPTDGRR